VSIRRDLLGCAVMAAASLVLTSVALADTPTATPAQPPGLVMDGGFNKPKTSAELRKPGKGRDWYESRRDKKGHHLLFLAKRSVAGNPTPKAMIKGDATLNTYLSQNLAEAMTGDFTISCDILVKAILAPANHSAFIMVGDNADKKDGPNSTGAERFVFLGFSNAAVAGKINLFAREGKNGFDQVTPVAQSLDLDKWYSIDLTIHPSQGTYEASVRGVTPQPVQLKAFAPTGKPAKSLTAISFASWNDGPGTFYVDNISGQKK